MAQLEAQPRTRWPLLLVLAAVIPVIWGPYLVVWELGFNSDAAVPYLMARHILGGERPTLFWGNDYMGAHEAYLVAGSLLLFGVQRIWAAHFVPLLAFIAGALILVRGTERAERPSLLVLLLAVPPGLFVAVVRPGFSQGTLLWLAWAAIIALRPGIEADPSGRRPFLAAGAAGVVLAVAWLYIPTALLGALSVSLIAVRLLHADRLHPPAERFSRVAKRTVQLSLFLGIGLCSQLIRYWTAADEYAPYTFSTQLEVPARILAKLPLLGASLLQFSPVSQFGPTTTGLNAFYGGLPAGAYTVMSTVLPIVTWESSALVFVLLSIATVGAVYRARGRRRATSVADFAPERVYWPLLAILIVCAYLASANIREISGARFLTMLFFPMIVCIATAVARMSRGSRALLGGAWILLVFVGHARTLGLERDLNADIDGTLTFLEAEGLSVGVADYWLAYTMTARSGEKVTLVPVTSDRYPPYRARVLGQPRVAIIDFADRPIRYPTANGVREVFSGRFGQVQVRTLEGLPTGRAP